MYKDVIVLHPSPNGKIERGTGGLDIFGYPKHVFPATDFHIVTFIPSLNVIAILTPTTSLLRTASPRSTCSMSATGRWRRRRRPATVCVSYGDTRLR
ncbi:hypothetical protein EJ02DRAFT_459403 [Clathrospora elynae]|uniref:Uncharacterized protein n=1 Tax=Clathrospora elynae TaxID=706981 RepID=A0A6A5SAN3_9PLEO|nr:hypothetical protein EJ02DRAFT_459403 [Clathrospora elynae]